MSELVRSRIADGVCEITLSRPERRNALAGEMADQLRDAVLRAPEQARAIVLTGAGSAFCAGADLKERAQLSGTESRAHNRRLFETIQTVATCPVPVVAAVNGPAYGGGFELALAADLRIADPSAVFALSEVKLGIIPGSGGTQRLFRVVGEGWARALLLSGRSITAEQARAIGVVQDIAASGACLELAWSWAREIAENAPLSVRALKEMFIARESQLHEGLILERETIFRLFLTEDRNEGLRAFAERRKPDYQGH